MSQPGGEQKNADQTDVKNKEKQPRSRNPRIREEKRGVPLKNACSTSPRVDADLGKSALMRIARLKNSLAKGTKRMVTKVQWLC